MTDTTLKKNPSKSAQSGYQQLRLADVWSFLLGGLGWGGMEENRRKIKTVKNLAMLYTILKSRYTIESYAPILGKYLILKCNGYPIKPWLS